MNNSELHKMLMMAKSYGMSDTLLTSKMTDMGVTVEVAKARIQEFNEAYSYFNNLSYMMDSVEEKEEDNALIKWLEN